MMTESFEGVVVHLRNFDEAHRIVELVTVEQGRIKVIARGGRASRRRFSGLLDLFVSLRIQALTRGDLWTLQSADVVDARVGIRARLDCFERAALLCECVRVLTPEHSEASLMYVALTRALDDLARGDCIAACAAYPKILAAAGILDESFLRRDARDADDAKDIENIYVSCIERAIGRQLHSRSVVQALRKPKTFS